MSYASYYEATEIIHTYGDTIHILDNPVAINLLSDLCAGDTMQPKLTTLIRLLYRELAWVVLCSEMPRKSVSTLTRMAVKHKEAVSHGVGLSHNVQLVTVSIARAGMVPSQEVYDLLNMVYLPHCIRQDHLFMSRNTDKTGKVTGVSLHDTKCGHAVDKRYVLFPDPMGATGASMCRAVKHYKSKLQGKPIKCIAMHLIVTPEYIKKMTKLHPDVQVYAFRLDRGLSTDQALKSTPGALPDEERGLDNTQYIIPGAGGIGELLNNSWV